MRNINNVVALIPEWEFQKLNISVPRRKVGNGYIINSKDLPNSVYKSFSLEVFKMGGLVMPMSEAEDYIRGNKIPFMFETPKIEEEITKGNDIEEELLELETLEEPIKEENEVLTKEEEIEK